MLAFSEIRVSADKVLIQTMCYHYLLLFFNTFSDKMPPTKACSYKEHDNLKKSTGKIPIQNIKTYKKFKKSVLSFLISKGFLEAHHNFCVMIVMTTVCVKLTLKIYGKRTL